ncbi:hypothetical protein GCM10011487_57200 [Steroidobacter agaridevorans]|uniref:Carrier domain-containing protein n=1 Tax=Steroidobacter agaridevorans TaxID=2695856 RepID=A0A829YKF0_9GAMM|nr:phosphopantetheine-binding protein [Steroidobacter agaridevorans]GFE83720.1 hypothetical protein GCM10011487_57200 [Steroidobacter agaridevorans]
MSMDSSKYARDSSKLNATIAELWKEILQLEVLPAEADSFFALGGDSMSMVMLKIRIKEELGIDIPDDAVLSAQTMHEFSKMVDAESKVHRELGDSSTDSIAEI